MKLKIACDVVIFTSPLCDNIIEVKNRFNNVCFNEVLTKTYRVFCSGTIENALLTKEKINPIIQVINDTENFVGYDENSGDIVL